jgi:hypothetical protein
MVIMSSRSFRHHRKPTSTSSLNLASSLNVEKTQLRSFHPQLQGGLERQRQYHSQLRSRSVGSKRHHQNSAARSQQRRPRLQHQKLLGFGQSSSVPSCYVGLQNSRPAADAGPNGTRGSASAWALAAVVVNSSGWPLRVERRPRSQVSNVRFLPLALAKAGRARAKTSAVRSCHRPTGRSCGAPGPVRAGLLGRALSDSDFR